MDAFAAYKLYLGIRLHFTQEKYDIGKVAFVNVSPAAFEKNKSVQYPLQRLARKYTKIELIEYLVANHVAGDKYGGVFKSVDGEVNYTAWKKRTQGLTYQYTEDLKRLHEKCLTIDDLFDCSHGHPLILKAYFGQTACLETLVILDKLFSFIIGMDERLLLDPTWSETSLRLNKYSPFMTVDKDKFLAITNEIFAKD